MDDIITEPVTVAAGIVSKLADHGIASQNVYCHRLDADDASIVIYVAGDDFDARTKAADDAAGLYGLRRIAIAESTHPVYMGDLSGITVTIIARRWQP